MKWFRFYSEALDDPKVQCLPIALRWHWVEILCLASVAEPRGRLRADVALAYRLRLRNARLTSVIRELVQVGLLDEVGGYLVPHGWDKRQIASDDVAVRVREHRARNVTETPPEAETEQEAETEKEKVLLLPARNIFKLYEQTFEGRMTERIKAVLVEAENEYPAEWIEAAFEEAAINKARSWKYVDTILRRWLKEEGQESAVKTPKQIVGLDDDNTRTYTAALEALEAQTKAKYGHGVR